MTRSGHFDVNTDANCVLGVAVSEGRFQRVRGGLLRRGQDVALQSQRDRQRAAAKHLTHHLRIDALTKQERRAGLPQVMRSAELWRTPTSAAM